MNLEKSSRLSILLSVYRFKHTAHGVCFLSMPTLPAGMLAGCVPAVSQGVSVKLEAHTTGEQFKGDGQIPT